MEFLVAMRHLWEPGPDLSWSLQSKAQVTAEVSSRVQTEDDTSGGRTTGRGIWGHIYLVTDPDP